MLSKFKTNLYRERLDMHISKEFSYTETQVIGKFLDKIFFFRLDIFHTSIKDRFKGSSRLKVINNQIL